MLSPLQTPSEKIGNARTQIAKTRGSIASPSWVASPWMTGIAPAQHSQISRRTSVRYSSRVSLRPTRFRITPNPLPCCLSHLNGMICRSRTFTCRLLYLPVALVAAPSGTASVYHVQTFDITFLGDPARAFLYHSSALDKKKEHSLQREIAKERAHYDTLKQTLVARQTIGPGGGACGRPHASTGAGFCNPSVSRLTTDLCGTPRGSSMP